MKAIYYKLVSWLLDHIWIRVGFAGSKPWQFMRSDDQLCLQLVNGDSVPKPRIILAARSMCFEIEKHIPVDSWREAYRIAQNVPLSSPFADGVRRINLAPAQAGGFKALITMVDATKIDSTVRKSMLLLLPISWVVREMELSDAVEFDCGGECFGLATLGEFGVTASLSSLTEKRDFWWSIGKEVDEVDHVSEAQLLNLLPRALVSLGRSQWLDASRGLGSSSIFSMEAINWTKFGQVAGCFFVGYLVLASLTLAGFGAWVSGELKTEPKAFTQALVMKQELNELRQANDQWAALVGEQYPVWVLWPVVEDLRLAGVIIRSARYKDGTAEFFLMADKATEVLDLLIANPYTTNVEFGASVRSDRRTQKEIFSLKCELADSRSSTSLRVES